MVIDSNTFSVERKDYLAFVHHYRFVKAAKTVWLTIIGYLVVMTGIGFAGFLTSRHHDVTHLAIALIPVLVIYALWLAYCQHFAPAWGFSRQKKNGGFGECRIHIDPSHVWTTSDDAELKKPWKSMNEVAETKRHVFLYFNKCNAFVIPKTAFSTPDDAETFARHARQYLADSRPAA